MSYQSSKCQRHIILKLKTVFKTKRKNQKPANGSDGGQSGRVVVEVDVGEHEGQAEVGKVVTRVKSV